MKQLLTIAFLIACLVGCASRQEYTLDFHPADPLRVVVLPFAQVDEEGNFILPEEDDLIVDPLLSSEVNIQTTPAEFLRARVQTELLETTLDIVSPTLVNTHLTHRGFVRLDGSYDYDKLFRATPKELCTTLFSCDAVLRGRLTKWERLYLGLQTVNRVEFSIELLSARDGSTLYQLSIADSESRGLTKGPTGYSSLVIEPISGLDNEIITDLARKLAKEAIAPLKVQNRPEFLETAPPAIFSSAHDGTIGKFNGERPLTVLMYGSPGQRGTFSIGKIIQGVPMWETDPGHYIGEYYPLQTDSFYEQSVVVSLTDEFGRTSRQTIGGEPLSLTPASK